MLNLSTPIAPAVIDFAWFLGYIIVQFFIIAQLFFGSLTAPTVSHQLLVLWTFVSNQAYIVLARLFIDLILCIMRIPKLIERNNQLLEEFLVSEDDDEASCSDSESSMPSLEPMEDETEPNKTTDTEKDESFSDTNTVVYHSSSEEEETQ